MHRLPLVPPPLSDEAISSWIARVAARYDASPYDLARVVLPKAAGYAEMYRLIDSRVEPRSRPRCQRRLVFRRSTSPVDVCWGSPPTEERHGHAVRRLGAHVASSRMSSDRARSTRVESGVSPAT